MKRLINIRKVSLATLLTFLVSTSVILTLLILTISSHYANKESLMTTYLSLNYSKSEKMSHSVESLFISMRSSLEATVDFLEEHEDIGDQEIREQLELLRVSSGYFNSLSWVDETGIVRSISPVSIGLEGTKIPAGVTKDVLDMKKPNLTTPYMGPTNRLLVLMSQPIYASNGTYRGMIVGTIYLQEPNVLSHILGNDNVEKNGSYYYVIGPKGSLLYHPEHELIGENINQNPIVRKLIRGKSGTEYVENIRGIPMLSAYSHVEGTGWGIVQQTPYSFVQNLLIDQLRQLLINVMLPFVLLLLLSVFIARKLATPFVHLSKLVNRLAEGKTVSQPLKESLMNSHWNREADLLTKSVAIAIEVLEKNNQKLTQSALTDSLTGLPNRRQLDEVLNHWSNENRLFSMLVLDVDHFKSINDTYGHQLGDKTLKRLARAIQSGIRSKDLCFRYGGEEFVLLLPDTDAGGAYTAAEKIRKKIEMAQLISERTVTVSIGLSEFPMHTDSVHELFRFADKALYESKIRGRNQTTTFS